MSTIDPSAPDANDPFKKKDDSNTDRFSKGTPPGGLEQPPENVYGPGPQQPYNSPSYSSQTPMGPPQYPGGTGGYNAHGKPDNYLVWAILSTLLCCLPAGVVSIVYAAKVDGLWMQGQQGAAREAAEAAKKWAIISAVLAGVGIALYVLFIVVLGVSGGFAFSSID